MMVTADREGRPRCSLVQRCAYFNFVYSDTDFIKAITQDQKGLEELDQWLKEGYPEYKGKSNRAEKADKEGQITKICELIQKLQLAFMKELLYMHNRPFGKVKYGTDLKEVMIDLVPELKPEATTSN
jgi:hypothetical protein